MATGNSCWQGAKQPHKQKIGQHNKRVYLVEQPALRTMPHQRISKRNGHHGFGDRYTTDADAGVMPTLGDHIDFFAIDIDRLARCQN